MKNGFVFKQNANTKQKSSLVPWILENDYDTELTSNGRNFKQVRYTAKKYYFPINNLDAD